MVDQALAGAPLAGTALAGAGPAKVGSVDEGSGEPGGFSVRVAGFEGPFDLLLALIAKRRIEVTELALHAVTDDFIAHIRGQGPDWDLDEATSFLVIAATLLDLKAARLLPSGSVEDEEDLALLEARDLLFARLLQYRAVKEVAALLADMMATASLRRARDVGLEPWLAQMLPEVRLNLTPEQFADLAARVLAPRPPDPGVSVEHVHAPAVSVREQAVIVAVRLRRLGRCSFGVLTDDAGDIRVVVGRFLALLVLYGEGMVSFDQPVPLAQLHVTWTGGEQPGAQVVVSAVREEFGGSGEDPEVAG